jgi:hypothetical protein
VNLIPGNVKIVFVDFSWQLKKDHDVVQKPLMRKRRIRAACFGGAGM